LPHAGQDDSQASRTDCAGRRTKQHIDSRAAAVFGWLLMDIVGDEGTNTNQFDMKVTRCCLALSGTATVF
jgi:hypothetical protein